MVKLVHRYSVDHGDLAVVILEDKDHVKVLEMELNPLEVHEFHFVQRNDQWRLNINTNWAVIHNQLEQDHQTLFKAKYCPWVAAVSHTQNKKKHVTLTFDR